MSEPVTDQQTNESVPSVLLPDEPAATDQPATDTKAVPAEDLPEWMKGIADQDVINSQYLKRFKSVEEVAKSALSAKQTLSKKLTDIPGEDATDDQLNQFYTQLGRPEKPEFYKLDLKVTGPDGKEQAFQMDPGKEQLYRQVAHASGLTSRQLNTAMQTLLKAEQDEIKAQAESLKKEKGTEYPLFKNTVNSTFASLPNDMKQLFAQLPPKVSASILHHFGKGHVEDVMPKDGKPTGGAGLETVEARIKEINQLTARDRTQYHKHQKELNTLYQQRDQLTRQRRGL